MFYLKDSTGKKMVIEEDNVYTKCPRCGKEHQIDLAALAADGELDLYGTTCLCSKCSEKMQRVAGRR